MDGSRFQVTVRRNCLRCGALCNVILYFRYPMRVIQAFLVLNEEKVGSPAENVRWHFWNVECRKRKSQNCTLVLKKSLLLHSLIITGQSLLTCKPCD